jgi:hypothetical protein
MIPPAQFNGLVPELGNPEYFCNNVGYTESKGRIIMNHKLNVCVKGNGNSLLHCRKLLRNKIRSKEKYKENKEEKQEDRNIRSK